jgi:hypothetical protein
MTHPRSPGKVTRPLKVFDYRESCTLACVSSLRRDTVDTGYPIRLLLHILHLNGVIGADDVLDAQSLPKVKMPNRDGFILFPRQGRP